jgi:hypothetical protein
MTRARAVRGGHLFRLMRPEMVARAREPLSEEELIPFSAVSGLGKDTVWSRIRAAVS